MKVEITVPGDKSISHRSVMLGAIAEGITEIDNFLMAWDCLSTIDCFRNMGVALTPGPARTRSQISEVRNQSCKTASSFSHISLPTSTIKVYGKGLRGLAAPKEVLYAGNSGTTARLMMGILAGQNFSSTIDGDDSLRKRPMKRVIEPLSQMGTSFEDSDFLPISVNGKKLKGIIYNSPISSAQIKSSVLLASLYADSETTYTEPFPSRNHTELMLSYFGADLKVAHNTIFSKPVTKLNAQHITIPGDISSAAFFITLGLISPNSQITIKNVGLNPTRTGILDIYKQMGSAIKIENVKEISNEITGDITVSTADLIGVEISGHIIPRLIDEIPAVAVAATQAKGRTIIKNASELKVKESNRIKAIVSELSKMGADIEETNDGIIINGPTSLKGAAVESHNDHRIAMSLAIAGKIADGETTINRAECVNISFPGFFELLNRITK